MKKFSFIGLFFSLLVWSCARGPVQEKKSVADYLSGENYQQTGNAFGVPLLERKIRNTIIHGWVHLEDPMSFLPGDVKVSLLKDGHTVYQSKVEKSGEFHLQGDFPNGSYAIEATSSHYKGDHHLEITSYRPEDVQFILHKIP